MIARDAIITEALTWLGTRFRANQSCKGVGCDCFGFVWGVGLACGVKLHYFSNYPRVPDGSMTRVFTEQLDKVYLYPAPFVEPEPGDILMMTWMGEPHHCGLYLGNGDMIHSYAHIRKVVKHPFDAEWRGRTRGVWRFRGVG